MITESKKRPEWVRKKISESKKGIPASEYSKKRASETHKGKITSPETKAKQSAAKKKPVRCENYETGELLIFPSVYECSRFLGYKPETLRYKCRAEGTINGWRLSYDSK